MQGLLERIERKDRLHGNDVVSSHISTCIRHMTQPEMAAIGVGKIVNLMEVC